MNQARRRAGRQHRSADRQDVTQARSRQGRGEVAESDIKPRHELQRLRDLVATMPDNSEAIRTAEETNKSRPTAGRSALSWSRNPRDQDEIAAVTAKIERASQASAANCS